MLGHFVIFSEKVQEVYGLQRTR